MSNKGRTVIFDPANGGTTYTGFFAVDPDGSHTAHQQLIMAAGLQNRPNLVGGSIKEDGHFEARSESINQQTYNKCQAHGNATRKMREDLRNGNYVTVSQAGNKNPGKKHFSNI